MKHFSTFFCKFFTNQLQISSRWKLAAITKSLYEVPVIKSFGTTLLSSSTNGSSAGWKKSKSCLENDFLISSEHSDWFMAPVKDFSFPSKSPLVCAFNLQVAALQRFKCFLGFVLFKFSFSTKAGLKKTAKKCNIPSSDLKTVYQLKFITP